MHLERSIQQPIREFVDMDHRWRGPDAGLIWCWERGRQKAAEDPVLAVMARKGVLMPLGFKGGVDKDKIPIEKRKTDIFSTWHNGKALQAKVSILTPTVILV